MSTRLVSSIFQLGAWQLAEGCVMATRDDDRFRVKPAPPKARDGQRSRRFVSQVLKQVSKAGAKASAAPGARPSSTFGRGHVAAGMAGQKPSAVARRVVIKSRYVVLKKAGANTVSTHLRYIERDGVTRDGKRGQAYGPESDAVDLKEFEESGRGDRHQFRFIVSVEDAEQLDDLRTYTREFMQRMVTDLETRLDWVAVDHWDTDNPHTHVVLRGRAANGQDLVIAPDYMAHGMRMRAGELATEWLGPRTELEIRQGLLREVDQERLTGLDRTLLRRANLGVVDLTEGPNDRPFQTMLRARLQRLETMELAERIDANHWHLAARMESTLAAMGDRGDILRTIHKALHGQQRDYVMPQATLSEPIVGRIAGKGLADEMNDRGYLVVDGVDGRAHYVRLPAGVDLGTLPTDGIVEVSPPGQVRAVDRTISGLARDGIYRAEEHLARLAQEKRKGLQATVDVHVRRLEGLRRVGIVERVKDGVWRVPPDLVQRAQAQDAHKAIDARVELRSHLSVDDQLRANGATWLDRQLLVGGDDLASRGFGVQVRAAMQSRADFLVELDLAERRGQRIVVARNLLSTLRDRELAAAGAAIQRQTGLIHRQPREGEHIGGIYRQSLQLTSGRFAMVDDGVGFSLVPWRPVIEKRLGLQVVGIMHGNTCTWQLDRTRGLSV